MAGNVKLLESPRDLCLTSRISYYLIIVTSDYQLPTYVIATPAKTKVTSNLKTTIEPGSCCHLYFIIALEAQMSANIDGHERDTGSTFGWHSIRKRVSILGLHKASLADLNQIELP